MSIVKSRLLRVQLERAEPRDGGAKSTTCADDSVVVVVVVFAFSHSPVLLQQQLLHACELLLMLQPTLPEARCRVRSTWQRRWPLKGCS